MKKLIIMAILVSFSATPSVTDTSSIWGISDYEQLEQLNLEVNKALSQITLIKDKASRLKIINPKNNTLLLDLIIEIIQIIILEA